MKLHAQLIRVLPIGLVSLVSLASPDISAAQVFVNPQANQQIPPRPKKEINLSGPRFGLTMLSPGNVEALAEKEIFLQHSTVSQFGWQFEKRLYTSDDGFSALTEFVPLLSGLEQGGDAPVSQLAGGYSNPSGHGVRHRAQLHTGRRGSCAGGRRHGAIGRPEHSTQRGRRVEQVRAEGQHHDGFNIRR
jgi:hypothetical protein